MGKSSGVNVAVHDLQTLFDVGVTGVLSDGQLLDRFVARREEAVFEAIVQRHGPMVWGVCRRVLRDHHDAEDAFQATFFVLARKASSVIPGEKLGNWLYGVAYQTARKARAMKAKRRGRESQVPDTPEPMVVPHDLRDALAESLDRELSRLPEKYRIPIALCDLEGRTHKEAASQLGWPIGTVSSRLSRARAILARRLSRRGVSLSGVSLTVLLTRDTASASMPTQLIGSTAQAASLIAAGGAATAAVVTAGVAALTGEVLKIMLLDKLRVATTLVLACFVLAAGGTGLAYRAQAEGPNQERNGVKPVEPSLVTDRLVADDEEPEELKALIAEGVAKANEVAKDKTPEQLNQAIQETTEALRKTRLQLRSLDATMRRLKKIRSDAKGRDDLSKLQGTWKSVKVSSPETKSMVLEIKGTTVTITKTTAYETADDGTRLIPTMSTTQFSKFKIRPEVSPKHFNLLKWDGFFVAQSGLYELDDDRLKICLQEPGYTNPLKLEAQEGLEFPLLIELQRER